ncbi:tudor domain-containing 6-like [Silurus meridionalis]|uniref:tudor domain-containing 6-like n=1 Tax=Silurus meridionalis TaxID=175797 RepID=UPI001EEBE1D8|nr:tudor domain-containing 6-like [Silurus meridionalis]
MYPDDNCWYRAVVRNAVLSNTADVEFIDYGNTAEVSVINMSFLDQMFLQPRYSIHCSLSGVVNDDGDVASNFRTEIEKNAEAFLCKFIQHSGSVWEVKLEVNGQELFGSACSKDLNEVTPKSPDSGYNLCDYKNPDLSIGQTVAVYASVIIGPQLFWCQYAEGEKLQEISDIIQNIGCTSESSTLDAETIPVRSACIALFDEDQLWYRAKVTSIEKDMLSVLFVDYGNESNVKVSDIRPLPFEVSDVPPQAFACQLDGFDVSEGSWNDKAADQFFELINDQHLRVTIFKLATLCDMVSPLWVQLEREELNINDAMKTCWTRNSKKESYELENATIAASVCETEHIVRSKDPICASIDYLQNGSCISPPEEQEEGNDTLAEHVEQTESTPLLNETSVELAVILSQDGDRILTLAGTEKPETYGKSISLKDTNVNADFEDIHSNGPADVLEETQLESTDFTNKGAFTGSQECEDENRVETVETESPEDQSCEDVCGKANELVSKPEEDHEIVESDPESRAGESGCVNWYHVLKIYDDSSLAEKETAQEDLNCSQVIDFEDMDEEPNAGMDLVVSKEQINLAQDKEQDPCFADVFAKSDCENQDSDLDLNAPQEMNQMFVADVSLEHEPALETSSKLELAQNICRALVQIQGEETSPPAEEQKVDHVTETYELMEVIPAMPLEKAEETEQEAGQCFFSHELNEEPPDVVHPDITEEQPQDEHRGSSLGDLMPEFEKALQEDGIQGPDLDFDAPHAPQEKGEMFIVKVPVEQSEPAMENNPAVELAQDLKMQVQPVEEPEETNPPVDQQRAVDHVTETCEQGDVLIEVIPAIPLDKALDVALDADPDNFVNETEQRSCETSDMIQVNMSDTGLPAADTEPSASQKPSDAEEQCVLAVTHLSLRVEDTANDDVVFVKEWQVMPPEVNESRGSE